MMQLSVNQLNKEKSFTKTMFNRSGCHRLNPKITHCVINPDRRTLLTTRLTNIVKPRSWQYPHENRRCELRGANEIALLFTHGPLWVPWDCYVPKGIANVIE